MSGHTTLGPGAEFDAVRALLARWGDQAIGIGDDGAVLDVPAGSRLVVSTDSTVEEVHFREAWLTPEEIGWRATTAALSDLAAMGAAPLGVLLALTVPERWRASLMEIADGVGAAVAAHRTRIVGGDVTDGDRLALAITVLGHAAHPLTRAGARAGDTLYVTGTLGGPGAALEAWLRGRAPSAAARARFAHPEARIAAGQWLAAHGAHAAIDLSDGVGGDARHLAFASGLRCVIEAEAIPRHADVSSRDAITSGEEYELLVAAPALDVATFAAAHGGLPLTPIGRFEALAPGESAEAVLQSLGARMALSPAHDHFVPHARMIASLRALVVAINFGLATFVFGSITILSALLRIKDKPGSPYDWCPRWWGKTHLILGRARVVEHDVHHKMGAQHIFVANHLSNFDVFALAASLPWMKFVAKAELFKVPILGPAMLRAGMIPIERANRKSAFKSYSEATERITRGASVAVYPEGTRGNEYALRPFKKGPFVLAIQAQAPVVPILVYGALDRQRKGEFKVYPGDVHLHYLPPIPTEGMTYDDRDTLARRTYEAMAACLLKEYGIPSPPFKGA